jgi:hypothetical protein
MEAKELYTSRVSILEDDEYRLVQSRLYYRMSSAITAVINGDPELFDGVPDDYMPESFKTPYIISGGVVPDTEWSTDFEFRFGLDSCGKPKLIVWIGTVIIDDEDLYDK